MARKDETVKAAMQELSAQYPRFGYRRIQVFLERRGLPMSAGPGLPDMVGGRASGADEAAASESRLFSAAAGTGHGREQGLGVRPRVRCLCQRAATEVSDGDRRVHP